MDFATVFLSPSKTLWTVAGVGVVNYLTSHNFMRSNHLLFLYSLSISSSNKQRLAGLFGSSFYSWLSQHA